MRVTNIGGRATVLGRDGNVDVEAASGGRFASDPQRVFDNWSAFRTWADTIDHADPLRPAEIGGPGLEGGVVLGPPVPAPRQVFAIALNYADHAREANLAAPENPSVFTKFPTCLTGPNDTVVLPEGAVDWEAELVVVIGDHCDHVTEASAWSHVAGLMVGQDISERRLQLSGAAPQFSLAKSFPGFGPIGPVMATPDEFADPDDLELGCQLEGGEILQKGRSADMIFPVAELVARLSAVCPLLPGDLIFSGTPAGIGGTRIPPLFLRAGDVLITWVESLGSLRNPMVALT